MGTLLCGAVLRELLTSKLGAHLKVINLLFKILGEWSQSSLYGLQPGRGIPQGNEVCSWLGTLYLIDLDREMTRFGRGHSIKYLRYVDDIMVFTKSRSEAREVVQKINHALRKLHLNMQTSKLDIIEKSRFEEHLGTNLLNTISHLVDSAEKVGKKEHAKKDKVKEQFLSLYDKHIGSAPRFGKLQLRIFKRLLTGFMYLRDRALVDRTWPILFEHPAVTDKVLRYLKFFHDDVNIPDQLLKQIKTDQELSAWQLSCFIRALPSFCHIPIQARPVLRKLATRMGRHWSVRTQAHLGLLHLRWKKADEPWCEKIYKRETHPQVKKVILLHIFRCRGKFRRKFMEQTIHEDDETTTRFRKFLHGVVNQPDCARKYIKLLMTDVLRLEEYLYLLYVILESKDSDVLKALAKLIEIKLKKYTGGHLEERLREIQAEVNIALGKRETAPGCD